MSPDLGCSGAMGAAVGADPGTVSVATNRPSGVRVSTFSPGVHPAELGAGRFVEAQP
jgi:hypothetical protein